MDNKEQMIDRLALAVEKHNLLSPLNNLTRDSYLGVSFKTLI